MSESLAQREVQRLLAEPGADPAALVAALAGARATLDLDPGARLDLDRHELAFLGDRAQVAGDAGFAAAVTEAQRDALRAELRQGRARPTTDVVALFDLTEQRARAAMLGMPDAGGLDAEVLARIAAVPLDRATVEEARERYAVLSSEEEEPPLRHRILLLQSTADVLAALARRAKAAAADVEPRVRKELARMAARLGRRGRDRVLMQRVERVLGRLGAKLLEATSLALLLVVFALLLLESWFELSPAVLEAFRIADGVICLFFVAEFGFKLALAPGRTSWFLRHALTDLLPAIPAVVFLVPDEAAVGATSVTALRLLRLFRITYFARYFQAMRPVLRLLRLLLFLVRGLDGLVLRFSPLLNRNFVFFERLTLRGGGVAAPDARELAFRALRREHVLLTEAAPAVGNALLGARAAALRQRLQVAPADTNHRTAAAPTRDVPVETAISVLYRIDADEVTRFLPRQDLLALDRVVRVLSAPVVRSLPFIRCVALRGSPVPAEPAARVVACARNVARYLERWRARMVFFADLHGIVTGPQLLDRVATAMMKASQRPAVRLLLFGALFFLVRMLVGAQSGPGQFLGRFVGAPLVILGSVCAVFLSLGWWLKRLAGEASESFKLTAEAQFIVLLDHVKTRRERDDARFLVRRVFRDLADEACLHRAALAAMAAVRSGAAGAVFDGLPPSLREEVHQLALLHLHFLDGSPLHESDVKTTEQILANPSLENLRAQHLRTTRKERKQLRKLSLSEGSIFSGPYLWFSFITESAAVETAKRITEYNRHCLTLEQQAVATAEERAAFATWIEDRRSEMAGRTLRRLEPPGQGDPYTTTEFCALDFLSAAPEREAHVRATFGDEVAALVREDRERMVREIFGMRPMHRLPRSRRSVNVFVVYKRWLSRGRVLLLPLFVFVLLCRGLAQVVAKTAAVVREILRPDAAARRAMSGRAPFAVALRKIHRMKAPGLLEAMRLRAGCDPEYNGAPATWSDGARFEERSELVRDMEFLHLDEREREEFVAQEAEVRARVARLHQLVAGVGELGAADDALARRHGERAVTMAWITDRDRVRTLAEGEACLRWLLEACALQPPPRRWLRGLWRRLRGQRDATRALLAGHFPQVDVPAPARRWLRDLHLAGDERLAALLDAAATVRPGEDWRAAALARLRTLWRKESIANRDLAVARAVQSLTVLDVRNYRELVFELGGYAAEGEDPALATDLP